MQSVLKVIVKNDERSMTYKHNLYDDYTVSQDDPLIKRLIDDALKHFGEQPDDVQIKISMTV